jgi:hypothetical protein
MSRLVLSPGEVQLIYDKLGSIEKLLQQDQKQIADPILTTEQLMKTLAVSRRCVQSWRDSGMIEFSAVKGKFYYRLSAIERMLDAHLIKGEGQ